MTDSYDTMVRAKLRRLIRTTATELVRLKGSGSNNNAECVSDEPHAGAWP
jgi:hypothetical protein